jgi:hypothetical protein
MKNLIPAAAIFSLLFSLNSCVNLEQKTKIESNGSGSMSLYYYTSMDNLSFGDDVGGFAFSEELVRENFSSSNIRIRNLEVYETLSDSVKHVKLTFDFDDIRRLTEAKSFSDMKITYSVTPDEIDFNYVIPKDTSTAYNLDAVKSHLDYEFELPSGEVVCANGKVSGDKVNFKRRASDLYDDIEMFIKIRR